MNLDDYLRIDAGASRFLMPYGDASVTLCPEEVSAYRALYEGLGFHFAGPIALMEPPAADRWEGLARIILDFRQLGFFTAHLPVEHIEVRLVCKFTLLSHGEPIDSTAAEIIMSHTFMARVEALNRGYVGEAEAVH